MDPGGFDPRPRGSARRARRRALGLRLALRRLLLRGRPAEVRSERLIDLRLVLLHPLQSHQEGLLHRLREAIAHLLAERAAIEVAELQQLGLAEALREDARL